MSEPVLVVEQLSVSFEGDEGLVPVIEDVSFELTKGNTLALVGESGCGKTLSALAILGLLPPFGRVSGGSIRFQGEELTKYDHRQLARIRGHRISMIFQEPMSALNPVFSVGQQISEALRLHRPLNRHDARKKTIEMLAAVGIPDPEARARDYPHQLSGGMRQRVLIAMALACDPDVLIADEPTTALDVTIQAQIMDLMLDLQDRMGTAILFISHDFGVVSHMADQIAVMYAGRIIEHGPAGGIIDGARHPYTSALLETTPRMTISRARLPAIPGRVPAPTERGTGCPFRPRCRFAVQRCAEELPAPVACAPGHLAACHEMDRV